MVMNLSCKFEKSTYNTLASREVKRKPLHTAAVTYSCVIHGGYNNTHINSMQKTKPKAPNHDKFRK